MTLRRKPYRLLLLTLPALAALMFAPAVSASPVRPADGHRLGSIHLVVSKFPLTGIPRRLAGPARSGPDPDISRVDCSSGSDLNWTRLYLDNGGTLCYGFKGTKSGLNDGPAYQFCSGNNHGSVYTSLGAFAFAPYNNNTANYYYFVEGGQYLSFYLNDIDITGWTGSAEC